MSSISIISHFFRITLSLVFFYSAYSKLYPAENFELYLYTETKLNWTLVTFISRLLISTELILGIFLIFNLYIKRILQASFLLLVFFTIYLGYKFIAGQNDSNCYCFGEHFEMNIGESIIKNIFMLIVISFIYYYKKITSYKYQKHFSILLILIGISLPIILSPPDYLVYKSSNKEHAIEINDSLLQNFTIENNETLDITKGKIILGFFSMKCKFCKLTSKKLSVFHEKYGSEYKTVYVFFGDSIHLDEFWEENNTIKFPYKIIGAKELLQISGPKIPATFFLNDGMIYRKYGYRDLNENCIKEFLHNID